jgi:hypothetical protein
MRERDTTHSYWYIPSAPRENYSLLVMETAGMMKMASVMVSPSGRVPERAPDWFFVATEAYGGGTTDLGLPKEFLEYLGIYRAKRRWNVAPRGPTPPGRAWALWHGLVGFAHLRPPLRYFL